MNNTIIPFFRKHMLMLGGALIGAVAGFLYWKFVGCSSGSCAITSSPVNSSLYGLFFGGVLFSSFKPNKK